MNFRLGRAYAFFFLFVSFLLFLASFLPSFLPHSFLPFSSFFSSSLPLSLPPSLFLSFRKPKLQPCPQGRAGPEPLTLFAYSCPTAREMELVPAESHRVLSQRRWGGGGSNWEYGSTKSGLEKGLRDTVRTSVVAGCGVSNPRCSSPGVTRSLSLFLCLTPKHSCCLSLSLLICN